MHLVGFTFRIVFAFFFPFLGSGFAFACFGFSLRYL
tara:strand:+ start:158 stop:265 length:108 start_codon:yes stop_codon:yes gene_type:complete